MTDPVQIRRIALIGFGEAGTIIGTDLAATGKVAVATYDILLDDPARRDAVLARAETAKVEAAPTLAQALAGAELVISAVTADRSYEVAKGAAALLQPGQIYFDINSTSPTSKQKSAVAVEAVGAHYVEAAVMGPFPPNRLRIQMLLGGGRAADLVPALKPLGLNVEAVADQVGIASAIKMCRSVMIKGQEALAVECLFMARHFGAEDYVLSSLAKTYPSMGWDAGQPDYLISRVAEHGRRRAAEMREVAATLASIGTDPLMAAATAQRQDWLADRMQELGVGYDTTKPFDWRELADRLAEGEE